LFYYIKGELSEIEKDFIVVESNGIGYKIFVPPFYISKLPFIGEQIKVYIYYFLREDNLTLYGFLTKEELNLFEELISVSGLGPKISLNLISNLGVEGLIKAVINSESEVIEKIPGVGKKTAGRIIVELKDKFKKRGLSYSIFLEDQKIKDVEEALMALGYNQKEITKALDKIKSKAKDCSLEELIKLALSSIKEE